MQTDLELLDCMLLTRTSTWVPAMTVSTSQTHITRVLQALTKSRKGIRPILMSLLAKVGFFTRVEPSFLIKSWYFVFRLRKNTSVQSEKKIDETMCSLIVLLFVFLFREHLIISYVGTKPSSIGRIWLKVNF